MRDGFDGQSAREHDNFQAGMRFVRADRELDAGHNVNPDLLRLKIALSAIGFEQRDRNTPAHMIEALRAEAAAYILRAKRTTGAQNAASHHRSMFAKEKS